MPCLKRVAALRGELMVETMKETRSGAIMQLLLKNRPVRLAKTLLKAMVWVSQNENAGSLNSLCKLVICLVDYEEERLFQGDPFRSTIVRGVAEIRVDKCVRDTHLCMLEGLAAYIVMFVGVGSTLDMEIDVRFSCGADDLGPHYLAGDFLAACEALQEELDMEDSDETMLEIFAMVFLKHNEVINEIVDKRSKKVLVESKWWNEFVRERMISICENNKDKTGGEMWALRIWIEYLTSGHDREAVHSWLASTPDLPASLTIIASKLPGKLHTLWDTLFKIREENVKSYRENVVMDLYTFGDAMMTDMQMQKEEACKNIFLWDAAFGAMLHRVLEGDKGLENWFARAFKSWTTKGLDVDQHSHLELVEDRMQELRDEDEYEDEEYIISEAEDMGLLPMY